MEPLKERLAEEVWVLGHKIRRWETDDSYGLVEITSPPGVPGPPPHYHKSESEFFLVMKGTLDVLTDGRWEAKSAGSFIELPPNTVHTFINNTAEDVVWVTGWRPKGFQKFFGDFGVPGEREAASRKSVSEQIVQRVVQGCESYGMFLKR